MEPCIAINSIRNQEPQEPSLTHISLWHIVVTLQEMQVHYCSWCSPWISSVDCNQELGYLHSFTCITNGKSRSFQWKLRSSSFLPTFLDFLNLTNSHLRESQTQLLRRLRSWLEKQLWCFHFITRIFFVIANLQAIVIPRHRRTFLAVFI